MKKLFSVISLLLLMSLLLASCTDAVGSEETTADTSNESTASTSTEETPREPGRYEYWLSDVSELAIEIDTKSNVAKFYSLQSGYYAYFTVHEGTYTIADGVLSIAIHDTVYSFTYDEAKDTYAIKNSASDQDDIVYERVDDPPTAHPSYEFPVYADLEFTSAPNLADFELGTLKQEAMEEAAVKIFLDYYSSSIEPYPEVTDRPVQRGDYVNLDYIGYLNGSIIEGAGATDAFLPIIAHPENIDNTKRVEDLIFGIVGHRTGETFEIRVNFPADYPNEQVAGKSTVFEVTINAIYDVALTDAQVQTYENLEFDTYADYLEGVTKQIIYDTAIPTIVAKHGLTELLPEASYMHFYQFYLDQAHEIAKRPPYEMEYEQYLTITGQSEEMMLAQSKQTAADFMLAYFLADQNNLTWTQDQYADQYELMVKEYLDNAINQDKAEELISSTRMDELYAELTYRIAGEWIANTAFGE